MEYLGRLLKYLKNYKLQIVLILLVQLLYAFFSIFTLTLLVPFLQVLFHQVETVEGVLEEECAQLMKDFFKGKR